MLRKSLVTDSDVIIYDLEDSIAPSEEDKSEAREQLTEFLTARLLSIDCCKLIARTENGRR
jgi:citrate lyase beta subunit